MGAQRESQGFQSLCLQVEEGHPVHKQAATLTLTLLDARKRLLWGDRIQGGEASISLQ